MKRKWTDLGIQIKKRLIDLDMTQVELAEAVGTNKHYLQKIMKGERSGEKYMNEILQILGLSKAPEDDKGRAC